MAIFKEPHKSLKGLEKVKVHRIVVCPKTHKEQVKITEVWKVIIVEGIRLAVVFDDEQFAVDKQSIMVIHGESGRGVLTTVRGIFGGRLTSGDAKTDPRFTLDHTRLCVVELIERVGLDKFKSTIANAPKIGADGQIIQSGAKE